MDFSYFFANAPANRSAQEYSSMATQERGQQLQNQMAQMGIQQASEQRAKEKMMQDLAKKYITPEGDLDQKGYLGALYGVDPQEAMKQSHLMQQENFKTKQLEFAASKEQRAAHAQDLINIREVAKLAGDKAYALLQLPMEEQLSLYPQAANEVRAIAARYNVPPPDMPDQHPGEAGLKNFAFQTQGAVKGFDYNLELMKQNEPKTEVGKLQADLKAGRIDQQTYDAAIKKATTHTPSTQVNVSTRQESEEAKAIGKDLGEQYADIQKAGMVGTNQAATYGRMKELLKGIETGTLTPTTMNIKALGQSLGFKVDENLGTMQAIQSLSNQMALELRNPAGGAGMPGSLSNSDRDYLVSMVPALEKTPEGNKIILETMMKLAQRKSQVAKLAREYRAKNKTFEGFSDYLAGWVEQHPLFGAKQKELTPSEPANTVIEQSESEYDRLRRGGK